MRVERKEQSGLKEQNMKKRKKRIYQKGGQVTVEYILLAVALITLFQVSTSALKRGGYLDNFVPDSRLFTNMIENGNWEIDVKESRKKHPNHYHFHYTPDGKGPLN